MKAVYTILKTLQYIHRLCALRPLLHIYSTKSMCTCVYSAYAIVCVCVCVYACVCAYVCVASKSPLFHKVFINVFFQSNFTACMSYLMWNRIPCSQGSILYCACSIICSGLVACLVGYAWVSELSASSLNRQLSTFSLSTLLTKTSPDEVHLSSTLSHERLTCISLMLAPRVLLRASRAALFGASCSFPSLWHLTT